MDKEPINKKEEENEDLVTLLDDEGNEVDFYHAATVDYKGNWYIFLQPAEEMEDIEEDEVVIFKLEKDEKGEDLFTPIDDEKLLDEVYHEYEKMVENACECGCGCEDDECDCGDEECDCNDEKCHCHDEKCDCNKK